MFLRALEDGVQPPVAAEPGERAFNYPTNAGRDKPSVAAAGNGLDATKRRPGTEWNHSVQDPALVDYLVEHQIPLEVCPTSNIATRAVDVLENHPLRELYDAGVNVTVNSDDPPMFGTTLNREYEIAADLLGLDERGIAELAKKAVAATFLPEADKAALAREIDEYTAGAATS